MSAAQAELRREEGDIGITAVGDIMLGEGSQKIGDGVRARWAGKRINQLLWHLHPYLTADLCIGNLECMLGHIESKDPSQMVYIGDPQHVQGLRDLGFTHLTLANNHILDQGEARAIETKQYIEAAGITSCSLPNPTRTWCKKHPVDIFTYNLIPDHTNPRFYSDRVRNEELSVIRSSDAYLKVACMHWGDEFSEYPSPAQLDLAHTIVDSGANLILGHHPHVTQGIEEYAGSLIVYSMGNFIFDMDWGEQTRSSFIFQANFTPKRTWSFRQIVLRQDRDYIPRILNVKNDVPGSDANVSQFFNDRDEYRSYASQQLAISRLKAILHMLRNPTKISANTWSLIVTKRLKTLSRCVRWIPRMPKSSGD